MIVSYFFGLFKDKYYIRSMIQRFIFIVCFILFIIVIDILLLRIVKEEIRVVLVLSLLFFSV